MNNKLRMNIVTVHPEITRLISDDYYITKAPPFARGVETLIDPSVEPEGLVTDYSFEREILETLFESFELRKLGI